MPHTTLVTPEQLAAGLKEGWVVVDCRFSLADSDAGLAAYHLGHLPGAFYAHLDRDLSGPIVPGVTGRHPLPDPAVFRRTMGGWGIRPGTQVVAYDDGPSAIAARLWWLLRRHGHEASAVLNGGFRAWEVEDRPVERAIPSELTGTYPERPPLAAIGDPSDQGLVLVDARAPERFRGEVEPIDPVAGHIPGAASRPFSLNVDGDGRFRDPAELRRRFADLGPPEQQLHYCGSGVTAAHNLLALEVAGLSGGRLYPGSWSEYVTDPKRPVAGGEGQRGS